MNYEQAWNDMKKWLKQGSEYLEKRISETKGKEQERLRNKLDGLKNVESHIEESERIYKD